MKHIEFAQLVDRFEGKLPADENRQIDGHVRACGKCAAASRKLADLFAYSPPTATETVPQATTARILNIYQRTPAPISTPDPGRLGLASLIFDDWQMAVNERYSGIDSRQMLFRVGQFDIDLRIDLAGDNARLAGQLFPETADSTAEIASETHRLSVKLNEFGEFVFDLLPRGIYDLSFTVGDEKIVIEQIPVQR
jgi:hypothetical protein